MEKGYVPHCLPGQNKQLKEFATDSTRSHAGRQNEETEYQLCLKELMNKMDKPKAFPTHE